jgi:hypothetical protein
MGRQVGRVSGTIVAIQLKGRTGDSCLLATDVFAPGGVEGIEELRGGGSDGLGYVRPGAAEVVGCAGCQSVALPD